MDDIHHTIMTTTIKRVHVESSYACVLLPYHPSTHAHNSLTRPAKQAYYSPRPHTLLAATARLSACLLVGPIHPSIFDASQLLVDARRNAGSQGDGHASHFNSFVFQSTKHGHARTSRRTDRQTPDHSCMNACM
mmetsp:Transcript_37105/g.106203  ORF Transcript_37105/g.106203 Transcript_37105/m.106203 type:complete len:134 (+) Transcript_37105:592-993(+)